MKTELDFIEAVGRVPEYDDMEIVNCPDAGKTGHAFCGWCETCNKPRFICYHALFLADPKEIEKNNAP